MTSVKNTSLVSSQNSKNNGEFLVCLPIGSTYAFNVAKKGYLFFSQSIKLDEANTAIEPFEFHIQLKPIKPGNVLVLRNLYFKTDSYQILEESYNELEKLVVFLTDNPGLNIEIGGHTDHVGTEKYNLELSTKRALEVQSYLISKGIQEERLKSKGYGYSQAVGSNETEEGRSLNRRTEIKVL